MKPVPAFKRLVLSVTVFGLLCCPGQADIAIYTVKDFQTVTTRPDETYQITGFVVDLYDCPPCPKDAVCAPCPWEYIVISDSPHKAKEENTRQELKILLRRFGPDGLKRWVKFLFTVQHSGFDEHLDLVGFKPFSDDEVQDLSVKVEEVVCTDDTELFDCKPRIMKAIENGDFALVQKIVQNGVDVNTAYPYHYGKTAFMHAVDEGKEEIAVYLLEQGADPGVRIPMDPLAEAEAQGLTEVTEKIKELEKKETAVP